MFDLGGGKVKAISIAECYESCYERNQKSDSLDCFKLQGQKSGPTTFARCLTAEVYRRIREY